MVFRFLDCVSCTIIVHVALTLISVVYKTKTIKEGFCIEGTWSREPLIYRGQQWSPVSLNLKNLVVKRIGKKMRGWKKMRKKRRPIFLVRNVRQELWRLEKWTEIFYYIFLFLFLFLAIRKQIIPLGQTFHFLPMR